MADSYRDQFARRLILNLLDVHLLRIVQNQPIWGYKIKKDIEDSYECRLTGSQAQAMNHGLAILPKKKCLQKEILFVETNTKKTKRLVEKNE